MRRMWAGYLRLAAQPAPADTVRLPEAHTPAFDLIVLTLSAAAGFIGSLVGLGGGALLVPGLVLILGVDMKEAVACSLVGVVFTSSAAGMVRGRDRFTNYRVGLLLEVVAGAASVVGAVTAFLVRPTVLQFVFGVVLLGIATLSLRRFEDEDTHATPSHPWARALRLDGVEEALGPPRVYHVQQVPLGLSIMGVAGVIAGMLGLGAGAVKVLSMDVAMKMPFRTSTVTSNFMIGATAAAGAIAFLRLGLVDPRLAGPMAVGIVPGAMLGSWLVGRMSLPLLRKVFLGFVSVMGVQMLLKATGVIG